MQSYKKTIIGVMGASNIDETEMQVTEQLGRLIAQEGWVLLTGGGTSGVMEAALKSAVEAGGETIGVCMGTKHDGYSQYATIPIFTNAGIGRDYINIISSDVIVVPSHISRGTMSEVAYALKTRTPLVLLPGNEEDTVYIKKRGGDLVHVVETPQQAIEIIKQLLT